METSPAENTIRVIITGATGMVGEGVLQECLQHPKVQKILVVNRRPCGVVHPRLEEIIHTDFYDWSAIAGRLTGYNACFFCLGVSSVGMKEPAYYAVTYTLTMGIAGMLCKLNPEMVFCYISGAGTDSSGKGRLMWARVKGKTENDLMKLPFKQVYHFRPGILQPGRGLKNTLAFYRYLGWMLPLVKAIAPNAVCSLHALGLAMIHAVSQGYEKQVLEVSDIRKLAGSA